MHPFQRALSIVIFLAAAAAAANADGFIVIHDPGSGTRPEPLAVKDHRVSIRINDQVAVTTVDQGFFNPNPMRLEGTYLFPLPSGSTVSAMSMWIDGKELQAELLPREEANKIYSDIVRRLKDPAILEYMGGNLFRMRIFPIEPRETKRIKIAYTERLTQESGLMTYRYPLSTEKFSSKPIEEVTLDAEIISPIPLASIFSPSHEIAVSHLSAGKACLSYEAKNVLPDRDFVLYCTLTREPFGAALAASREPGREGTFALFIAPGAGTAPEKALPKDVVFVLDTSGSMKEPAAKPWKIDQARAALAFCLNSLGAEDRFNIIAFSTLARSFCEGLQPVTDSTRVQARSFIDALEARGGTNIHEALEAALAMNREPSDRPFLVLFLTDGQPTLGTLTRPEELVAFAREKAKPNMRLFVFGVGYDVNTHLLDKLALDLRGDRIYVSPEESIETRVAGFYDKISHPVLSAPKVEIAGVEIHDLYPPRLPDLFQGSQAVLYGRYRGPGNARVRLSGSARGEEKVFSYEVNFPESDLSHPAVPRLWASAKIGHLLDALRLNGIDVSSGQRPQDADRELVEEIVALATEYGIVTPYTALLVLEDSMRLAGSGSPVTPTGQRLMDAEVSNALAPRLEEARLGFTHVSGKAAFDASRQARDLKKAAESAQNGPASTPGASLPEIQGDFKVIAGRTFIRVNGTWVDSAFQEGMEVTQVAFLSDAYFDLIARRPEIAPYLAAGEKVKVVTGGKAFEITE